MGQLDMHMFANVGGTPLGGEDICFCCGIFPILPLVVFLIYVALTRSKLWAACLALFISGVPYFMLLSLICDYKPSEDGDIMSDQATGRRAFEFYGRLATAAGLSLIWAIMVRLFLTLFRLANISYLLSPIRRKSEVEVPPVITEQNSKTRVRVLNMVDRLLLRIALYILVLFVLPLLMVAMWKSFFSFLK
jgi:hypothetical protein